MSEQHAGEAQRRIGYIDGLRAVAVLAVVVHHAAKYDSALSPGPAQHALLEGAHGVDLFFVISGFCLSYPFLNALRSDGVSYFNVVGYIARRVVRIVPPYYFAIAILSVALLALPRLGWSLAPGMMGANLSWVEIVRQMLFADRHPQFVNGSFWSLAVEWRWYLLFPLLLVLWTRSARAFVTVGLACVLAALLTRTAGFDLPILPAFMLGIIAADVERRQLAIGRYAGLLCILAACVALVLEPKFSAEFFRQDQAGWQVAAFFFLIAAGNVGWLRTLLSLRPVAWIGVASYSIYLVHEPVIGLLEHNTATGPLLAGIVAVGCGATFWAVFERPFVSSALKKRAVAMFSAPVSRLLTLMGIPVAVRLARLPSPEQAESESLQVSLDVHAHAGASEDGGTNDSERAAAR